jgi:deoxyribodipyrimidine photolyase
MDIPAEAASFDPEGEFVRRWLPVLARMPTQHVHAPWTAPQVCGSCNELVLRRVESMVLYNARGAAGMLCMVQPRTGLKCCCTQ